MLKEKELYLDSGYLDMAAIIETGIPFIIITGGRGVGKTFGALEYIVNSHRRFLFMRRTEAQVASISDNEFNVFNPLNKMYGYSIYPYKVNKTSYGYYESKWNEEKGKYIPQGQPIGYLGALSTISNKRGFDASSIDIMILDEFCPEKHERAMKNEDTALFNAYETINRNRELEGRKPLQCILLANANDIASRILIGFNAIKIMERMRRSGRQIYVNDSKTLMIVRPNESKISEQKRNTVLYQLTKNSDYEKMAIDNEYAGMGYSENRSRVLNEYVPVVFMKDIYLYKHKSRNEYYVSEHKQGKAVEYDSSEISLMRFRKTYNWLQNEYINNHIIFENTLCEILFTQYMFRNNI